MSEMPMSHDDVTEAMTRSALILVLARSGKWGDAYSEITALAQRFDGPGIQILITGLADTMTVHQGGHARGEQLVSPVWVDECGNTTAADEVTRPEIVWAGRFVAARAALDEDACAALVNSCADDPRQYSENVLAVLEVAANTLNAIEARTS